VPLREKQSVKMGTAWIVRQNCLVWEQDRKCLVCDEVCPYNALSFRPVKGLKNAAPFVLENRCTGCGWCENKCPVLGASAIRVNVIGEVRLAEGSYLKKAKQLGLEFRTKDNRHDELGRGAFDDFEPAPQSPDNTTEPEKEGGDLPAGFILE
jgi:Fe-S-cluster-containing hydrogenase component 2